MDKTDQKGGQTGIKQIAKLAGVSIGTIDRVLHNRPGVSMATRRRVTDIIEKTGYKKNTVASRLKLAASKKIRIGALLPVSSDSWSYWKMPTLGVDRALQELKGLGVTVNYHHFTDATSFARESEIVLDQGYHAVISVPFFGTESNRLLRGANLQNIPVVFLDTEVPLNGKAYFIRQNSHFAGLVAGRLLYGLVGAEGSFLVINMLNSSGLHTNNQQREKGFRDFFKKHTKEREVKILTMNHPLEKSFELDLEMESWFDRPGPKGIFVTNARSFLISRALKSNNIENVFIVGFDVNEQNKKYLLQNDIHFLIDQKPEFQGYTAIKGLYKYLTENETTDLNLDIPVEIIVAENCEIKDSIGH